MKIICVDDEELVLALTVSMCKELSYKPEVEGFDNGGDALDYIKKNAVDIAILDINMPEMDGITLAAKIKEINPDVSIMFLTGYSEYAVDAYAIHASGYLLKPVNKKKLEEEVEYALTIHPIKETSPIRVRTFGKFDLYVNGRVVSFSRAKSKELLAYLIDRQGGSVSRADAFAAIWEEGMYDRSMQKQLDVIIRSLKSTLAECGASDILEMQRGVLRVVPDKIDCDLYRFFDLCYDYYESYDLYDYLTLWLNDITDIADESNFEKSIKFLLIFSDSKG